MIGRIGVGTALCRFVALCRGRRVGGASVGNLDLTIRKGRRIMEERQEHREVSDVPVYELM